jgi:hypothetical protein
MVSAEEQVSIDYSKITTEVEIVTNTIPNEFWSSGR